MLTEDFVSQFARPEKFPKHNFQAFASRFLYNLQVYQGFCVALVECAQWLCVVQQTLAHAAFRSQGFGKVAAVLL